MKKTKLGITAITVIISAIATQAFKIAIKSERKTKAWLAYTSTDTSAADYSNVTNYTKVSSRGTCRTNNQLREVFASSQTL